MELQALVLGRDGIVLFDSIGQREGEDFSQWRDVRGDGGEYRARTTPRIPGDELSSVMYISAPVRAGGEIVGVVSVGKPVQSPQPVRRRGARAPWWWAPPRWPRCWCWR